MISKKTPATPQEVREWARNEITLNVEVPNHGKIPRIIRTAFTERTGREIALSERTQQRAAKRRPKVLRAKPEPEWMVQGRLYARNLAQIRIEEARKAATAS